MTTASGRPDSPCFLDTNSFGFSAVESMYTRSPRTAYRARVAWTISRAPIDRYRKMEAPISHTRARASNPWASASFWTLCRETAAVAITAAAIAKPRITRSEIRWSSGVATRSARNRKYTAARSQIKEIALRVSAARTREDVMKRSPIVATIDAAIAKYRTPASASRAFASWTSIPFRSAEASSCFFSPSASSGPSSGARPRLSHQLSGQ